MSVAEDDETLAEELSRLLAAWHRGERQNRQEAWNLIADFTIENGGLIATALGTLSNAVAERFPQLPNPHQGPTE